MTEIYVKVEPGSSQFKVENGQIPRIKLESEAENGKANTELKQRIENITGKKPGIVSGHRSRRKKIVVDMPEEELRRKLGEANG
jgi:uncharacterized protein YggU (UPF0235/DUF167 family)